MVGRDYFKIEKATNLSRGEVGRLGSAIIFIVGVMVFTGARFGDVEHAYLLVAAAVIGAYMAMNIGANDVANNVGPAVGSLALSLSGAILIAAIFEASGAIIAGGDVIKTVKDGIVDPADLGSQEQYVWVMMGALAGAAIWLNGATWIGAPVSTTHSLAGGAMLLAADLAVRLLSPGRELKLGVVTALIGAPFFLWLILAARRREA